MGEPAIQNIRQRLVGRSGKLMDSDGISVKLSRFHQLIFTDFPAWSDESGHPRDVDADPPPGNAAVKVIPSPLTWPRVGVGEELAT